MKKDKENVTLIDCFERNKPRKTENCNYSYLELKWKDNKWNRKIELNGKTKNGNRETKNGIAS